MRADCIGNGIICPVLYGAAAIKKGGVMTTRVMQSQRKLGSRKIKLAPSLRWGCILSFLIFALALPAHAASQTALTMHGAPKNPPGFTHYSYANPDAPKGGTLKQAVIGTFDTLNPFTLKGKPPAALGPGPSLVYDRLTDRSWDEPFTLYPLIAKSWDIPDDRSSITIHIDPRARFHDHTAITSDDLKFSFETLRDHGRPNMRRVYQLVSDVRAIDDRTIKFTLGPGHDRETVMIVAMMPVISHAYYQGRDFNAPTMDPGMGTGPYRVKYADPGRRIVYERVPDYWAANLPARKGLNNFDEIVYDYFRDDTVAFEAFKSGTLNFRREIDVKQWAIGYDIPPVRNGKIKINAVPHGRAEVVRGFIMNTRRPPFDDVRVRRALSHAFDFDWINRNLYAGMLQRTNSFFPNTDLAYQSLGLDPRDSIRQGPPAFAEGLSLRDRLITADALLKDAGFMVENGVRITPGTGKPMRFEILLGSSGDEKIALSFIRTLKTLGITARARTLDQAAFRDRLNTYDYDMVFYFWQGTLSPGGEQALYWGCAARDQPGRFNYAGICDPDIDHLSGAIAQTTSRQDLITLTYDLDKRLMDGAYIIPFGYLPVDLIATDAKIIRPDVPPLYGVVPESWWAAAP
jgi:microcin C transport system substrate-binding protein